MFHILNENGEIVLRAREVEKNYYIETFDVIEGEPVQITISLNKNEVLELIENLKSLIENDN